jgi:hypothetical protein
MTDFANENTAASPDRKAGTFRLGTIALAGETAELAKQDFKELSRAAHEQQGLRAFEDPKSSAVVHEAGHAVLYAYHGIEMKYVKVSERKKGIQRGHWVGNSQTVNYKWGPGPDTLPEDDFKNACIIMAGRIAEELFDRDNRRLGSSLDEVIKVRMLSRNISQKTGLDPNYFMMNICAQTCSILQKNESVVRKIVRFLERNGVVRGKVLGSILAQVERPS